MAQLLTGVTWSPVKTPNAFNPAKDVKSQFFSPQQTYDPRILDCMISVMLVCSALQHLEIVGASRHPRLRNSNI
jgi:hypothetical protein